MRPSNPLVPNRRARRMAERADRTARKARRALRRSGRWTTAAFLAATTSSFGLVVGGAMSGMAAHPAAAVTNLPGYWVATAAGGVTAFGGVPNYGQAGGRPLAAPIVGIAPTPDGRGYWEVGSDGGVFTFGDAGFYGSTGAIHLARPVVGMAPTPDGRGYWLVASDGGVFTFGDAGFYGSTGNIRINAPMVGMAATPDGRGYWLVGADGGIFTGGDAPFRGSDSWSRSPVVGIATGPGVGTGITPDPNPPYPPPPPPPPPPSTPIGKYPSGSIGYDISWPQCGSTLPGGSFGIAIVGVNDGRAGTVNPCLPVETSWAGSRLNDYINLNSPNGSTYNAGATGPAGNCAPSDAMCWSYNYGWTAAWWSEGQAAAAGAQARTWWLDVETGNYWSGNLAANARVIQGAIDELHYRGLIVGVYSTNYQWGVITGGARPGVPVWYATGSGSLSGLSAYCNPSDSFTGGPVWMIQGGLNGLDGDYAC